MATSLFQQPAFLDKANIYEVNIRQYTTEGTFNAFARHLPRLKDMGVQILWMMPIHPIGIVKRKGNLGSYYSIQNHTDVNPEFGTKDDLLSLIIAVHAMGMKIIFDWVANHTSWDNIWTLTNPEFFVHDEQGNFKPPYDWEDVLQIDHTNKNEQAAMINAMKYWVTDFDIDGFRADLAHLTPLQFWKDARTVLSACKKDLIWLAETEEIHYHEAFDISFTWNWMHRSEEYCKDKISFDEMKQSLIDYKKDLPENALKLFFTANHDENTWNGTEYDKYGNLAKAFTVLDHTVNGIPLIYSGQEIPNKKRLEFFEKDSLQWTEKPELHTFYKTLVSLRHHSGAISATGKNEFAFFHEGNQKNLLSYSITKDESTVLVFLNLGKYFSAQDYDCESFSGNYKNIFTGEILNIQDKYYSEMDSGGYTVLEKIK
jgi:glycosidase